MSTLMVIAKAPVAGRVKTRLTPPCSPTEAAQLARAALLDTFAAMAAAPVDRRVVVLDGPEPDGIPPGFKVIPQRGDGLAERLAAAFADCGAGAFVVAMDTPQVAPELLGEAVSALGEPDVDVAIGATPDGGYWGIGFAADGAGAFDGVPMSQPDTFAAQCARLRTLGLRTRQLPPLRDIDSIEDARAVAAIAPQTRFAAALRASGHAGDEHQPVAEAAT